MIRDAADAVGLTFELHRQGGNHEIWTLGGLRIAIPRHREITPGTAESILRQAGDKLGKDWWR